MTKPLILTLIIGLILVNIVAVSYIALQYSSSLRTTVFQPSDELNEFGYSDATASQERTLQSDSTRPGGTGTGILNTADCKVTLSDCRLACQANWDKDAASGTSCFSDCEVSWQFCTR